MSGVEQVTCLAQVKWGADPSMWANDLPTWLLDAEFAQQFRPMVEHGKAYRHLADREREALIVEREFADDHIFY